MKKEPEQRYSTSILILIWLSSCTFLTISISTIITMNYSLKIPAKQIDTLEKLVNTDMSMVVWPTFVAMHKIPDESVFDKICARAVNERTVISLRDLMSNVKWIVDTSLGRNAIFFYEVPLKQLVVKYKKYLKPNTKFRFINERWGLPSLLTIAITTRFNKELRNEINLRLVTILSNYNLKVFFTEYLGI